MDRTWIRDRGLLLAIGALAAINIAPAQEKAVNRYSPYPQVVTITEGISWPKGQALPIFATPAKTLDTLLLQDLSKDEQITFSGLQGLVNRQQPRIYLLNARADEGAYTWADTPSVNFKDRKLYTRESKYDLVAKYAKEAERVVLYDPEVSPHYRNLAGTVAGLNNAIPVTAEVLEKLKEKGVKCKIAVDLTDLKMTSPIEIYEHLYDHYWEKCDKRLLISAKPHDEKGGGNYHHTRDIGAAGGAAVVWLNTLIPKERDLLKKFFGDMKAGEAVVLGWYTTERSGIGAASEFGIGTLPADFYVSGSVYSGTERRIQIPPVPKKPELENKVYLSIFISDGDNIQYTQHAMRKNWDRTTASRGKIPLNWTIAPGLVDVGPGILNYYYTSATPKDCFVTGPSGMGYMNPYNTLIEPGAPIGEYLKDESRMDGYAKLTETYLQRSGLRVITIWDEASPMHRKSYEKHCRNLYGATVQNFKDVPSVASSVEAKRVPFDKLGIPYAGSYEHIHGSISRAIKRWDGKEPLFLSYQIDVWGELNINRMVELNENLGKEFPDKVEFVRADHYFNLINESKSLPYNLTMDADIAVRTADSSSSAELAMDGTPSTMWTSSEKGKSWLGFELGEPHRIGRYIIRHAGDHGLSQSTNTSDFAVQTSTDGKTWKTVSVVKGNKDNVTDIEFELIRAKFLKVLIDNPGADSTARIADVEFYGTRAGD